MPGALAYVQGHQVRTKGPEFAYEIQQFAIGNGGKTDGVE